MKEDNLKQKLINFLGVEDEETAEFLTEFLKKNLRELRHAARAAYRQDDWAGLDLYAQSVLALGENLDQARLVQGGNAVLSCIRDSENDRLLQVLQKINRLLSAMEQELAAK